MGKEWVDNLLRRIGLVKSNKPTCPEMSSPEGGAMDKEPLRYKKASENEIKYTDEETALICEMTKLMGKCSENCGSCALYIENNRREGRDGE